MTLEEFLRHFGQYGGPVFVLAILPLAGIVASSVCPCTIPVGIGIAGMTSTSEARSRKSGFSIAAAFFTGIVINLALLRPETAPNSAKFMTIPVKNAAAIEKPLLRERASEVLVIARIPIPKGIMQGTSELDNIPA